MSFDKELLFKTFATKIVPIVVKDGDEEIHLFARELSAKAVFAMQSEQKKDSKGVVNNEDFSIALIAKALCDEDGKPIMTREEAQQLSQMRVRAFNNLAETVAVAVGLKPPEPKPNGADGKPAAVEPVAELPPMGNA